MIIHCLSSTYSSHGVLTSRLQICASILLADVRQPTQLHDQKQYRSQDYPTISTALRSLRDPTYRLPAKSIQSPYTAALAG
jgi:hypothetical protein